MVRVKWSRARSHGSSLARRATIDLQLGDFDSVHGDVVPPPPRPRLLDGHARAVELLNDLEALQLQGEGIRKAIGFSTTIMKLRKGAHATEVGSDNPTRLDQSADVLVRMKSER